MAILLLFNQTESLTVQAVLDKTQIDSKLCIPSLVNLLKGKLLTCAEIVPPQLNDEHNENVIKRHHLICVDHTFQRFVARLRSFRMLTELLC